MLILFVVGGLNVGCGLIREQVEDAEKIYWLQNGFLYQRVQRVQTTLVVLFSTRRTFKLR